METGDWQALQNEILNGLKEWRLQHPKATFGEIEVETMKRMAQLQARIMQDLAQASQAADWEAAGSPVCPQCGVQVQRRGQEERSLQAAGGEEVVLRRTYATCPVCGTGFFPLG